MTSNYFAGIFTAEVPAKPKKKTAAKKAAKKAPAEEALPAGRYSQKTPQRKRNNSMTVDAQLARQQRRRLLAAQRAKVVKLYESGWKQVRIAEELELPAIYVHKWLKKAGVLRERGSEAEKNAQQAFLESEVKKAVEMDYKTDKMIAREQEEQSLLELAENQASPADKYQAYIAAMSIKMLRDNLANIRGPRTVREMSELDQLIRRNLGLAPKGGTGISGGLTIDISVLNNTKASRSNAIVVEAQPSEPEEE